MKRKEGWQMNKKFMVLIKVPRNFDEGRFKQDLMSGFNKFSITNIQRLNEKQALLEGDLAEYSFETAYNFGEEKYIEGIRNDIIKDEILDFKENFNKINAIKIESIIGINSQS